MHHNAGNHAGKIHIVNTVDNLFLIWSS